MISPERLKMLEGAGTEPYESLTDIKTVGVNTSLGRYDRILRYMDEVQNPYQFRVGDTAVRVRYNPSGPELRRAVSKLISEL